MITFLLIIAGIFAVIISIGYFVSAPAYEGPVTDHFDGKKFKNPGNVEAKGFADVLRWVRTRERGPWPMTNDFPVGPKPVKSVDSGIRVTFVNHSTFLIQVAGLNIITDPVWSLRTSPVEWAGPKRKRPPGLLLEDLPKIDLLLLSHNHWDHLDIETVKKIVSKHNPRVITSLGVAAFLKKHNIQSTDLDWWDEATINNGIQVQAVPAQHFSGRGMFDRDATLWVGYVIKRAQGNIYFAGDTGYNTKTFKEIGEHCAPIAVALVPIGAYKPQWFMSPIHCSPEESVIIHQEIKAQVSIATHFGTFQLADDGKEEPVDELRKAMSNAGIKDDAFIRLKEGTAQNF